MNKEISVFSVPSVLIKNPGRQAIRATILLTYLLLVVTPISAEIIEVFPGDAGIQDAIDVARPLDTVLVHPGRYVENISFEGKDITVASLILTTGNPAYIDSTIIDGDSLDCVVNFNDRETERAVLRGFTITNGHQNFGGGIDCQVDVRPQLMDLLVTGNTSVGIGGGIYCTWYSTPTITRCRITGNSSDEGGGFGSAHEAHPIIRDCEIYGNTGRLGGGVFAGHGRGELSIESSYITHNTASLGGGIYFTESHHNRIINCTIANNEADSTAGGMMLDDTWEYSDVVMVNNIIWGNHPGQVVSANTSEYGPSDLAIAYCDIQGGEEGILTSGYVGLTWLEGNIDENPIFYNAQRRNFWLRSDSPCIDAGTEMLIAHEDTIIINQDRISGEAPDMGAFEYDVADVNDKDGLSPTSPILLSVYPNPFNAVLRVDFNLVVPSEIVLKVYNLNGQLLSIIDEGLKIAGAHSVSWNGKDFASGVYILQLETSRTTSTKKLILMR